MNKALKLFFLCVGCVPMSVCAQDVDASKYTDYTPDMGKPAPSLLVYGSANKEMLTQVPAVSERPDHVNNMETRCFPPVFNQSGGSCGSASRIGYMFTHEMNAYRNVDGAFMENCYPTHFVWLLTSGNSGKQHFMREIGIPSATTYGGRTYSALFGNQSDKDEGFGWMNGYDKWYSGMFNRIADIYHIPSHLGTEIGREALKNWLWNHNGDLDFTVGGLGGIGVATGALKEIPSSPVNDEIGLTGLKCVDHWGTTVNHALTIVGYDDRVEFDLNGNGIIGETSADEKGAWIIVNSWGTKWANGGAVYCPYAYGGRRFDQNPDGSYTFDKNNWWYVEVLGVRKNYRPLRTIKVKMDYSHRSEIALSAGVSSDLKATTPERVLKLHHFQYAGDGARGTKNPAPEMPMLGRWADGRLHTEPMEFGYDLTDLTAGYDYSQPLKYFFIIDTKDWAVGKGHIYDAAIMDYQFDTLGLEFPFEIEGQNFEIQSQGKQTVITAIVRGDGYVAPENVVLSDGVLSWDAPKCVMHKVVGYNIYKDKVLIKQVGATVHNAAVEIAEEVATYGVTAVYENDKESVAEEVMYAHNVTETNAIYDLNMASFAIPGVFDNHMDQATIEFWISPKNMEEGVLMTEMSHSDFFISALEDGSVSAGWTDTKNNKLVSRKGILQPNVWSHVALVVDGSRLSLYVNGALQTSFTSRTRSGIGGCDEMTFKNNKKVGRLDVRFDEIRIWDIARSSAEIGSDRGIQFMGKTYPVGLKTYYKGNLVRQKGQDYFFDCVGGHHARVFGDYEPKGEATDLRLLPAHASAKLQIIPPTDTIYVGMPVVLNASYNSSVTTLIWTVPALGIKNLALTQPTFVFDKAGSYEIVAEAQNQIGIKAKDTCYVNVVPAQTANADFTVSKLQVPLGERVSFHVTAPLPGYTYQWSMPGAQTETMMALNAATTYAAAGKYDVTLNVVAADGHKVSNTQCIEVMAVKPVADFEISSAVIEKGNTVFLKDLSKYNPTSWQWLLRSQNKIFQVDGQHTSLTMEAPGVYDILLSASNEMGVATKQRKAALVVCNADSKTGLAFTPTESKVVLSKVPLSTNATAFTIDWWMNPDRISTYSNGMGEGASSFLLKNDGDGTLYLTLKTHETKSPRKFVIPYEWHHYAVTFKKGAVSFYRDGVMCSQAMNSITAVPMMKQFALGLEHMNMSGMMDELRIWESCLSETEIQQFANAPIQDIVAAENEHQLKLYYDFNQGSGDVMDATTQRNVGIRQNFGPDGDAWGLSTGVFCLNFDTVSYEDVTAKYLKNFQAPFAYDGDRMTHQNNASCHAIADWTLENTATANNSTAGVYVDAGKQNLFTCQTGWSGFANLVNHKAYQTVTLPAGTYEFVANYGYHNSKVKNIVMAVALGKGLPDAKECDKNALASVKIEPKSEAVLSNRVMFTLAKDAEVSLGLVFNMAGKQCFTMHDFQLTSAHVEKIEADGASGYELTVDNSGYQTMYLPYAVRIPKGVQAYVATKIEQGKVRMEAITDGVVPAHTGVVIVAAAGHYRFSPSTSAGKVKGLLQGVTKETAMDSQQHYYVLNAENTPCFVLAQGDVLPANSAYFALPAADEHQTYEIEWISVGVEKMKIETEDAAVYDLSGRRVKPETGVYISNGKKFFAE